MNDRTNNFCLYSWNTFAYKETRWTTCLHRILDKNKYYPKLQLQTVYQYRLHNHHPPASLPPPSSITINKMETPAIPNSHATTGREREIVDNPDHPKIRQSFQPQDHLRETPDTPKTMQLMLFLSWVGTLKPGCISLIYTVFDKVALKSSDKVTCHI